MDSRKTWIGLLVVVLLVGAWAPAGIAAAPEATGPVDDVSALTDYWRGCYPDQFTAELAAAPEQFEPELLAKAEPDECFNGPGVPYTGTVVGSIVISEDAQKWTFAYRCLRDEGHQVVWYAVRIFSYRSGNMRAHGVEVSQQDDLPCRV